MPGFDGSGPYGDGRPGRGLGPCGRFDNNRGLGFNRGLGLGRGRRLGGRGGWGNRWFRNEYPYYPEESDYVEPYTKENLQARKRELDIEIKWLDEELKAIDEEKK